MIQLSVTGEIGHRGHGVDREEDRYMLAPLTLDVILFPFLPATGPPATGHPLWRAQIYAFYSPILYPANGQLPGTADFLILPSPLKNANFSIGCGDGNTGRWMCKTSGNFL